MTEQNYAHRLNKQHYDMIYIKSDISVPIYINIFHVRIDHQMLMGVISEGQGSR